VCALDLTLPLSFGEGAPQGRERNLRQDSRSRSSPVAIAMGEAGPAELLRGGRRGPSRWMKKMEEGPGWGVLLVRALGKKKRQNAPHPPFGRLQAERGDFRIWQDLTEPQIARCPMFSAEGVVTKGSLGS
jgi:hypothetical protein